MHISLIGMSGVGKSHWSTKLASEGEFKRLCCDDDIEQILAPKLAASGYPGDMAGWMGQPYLGTSTERQALYLAHEADVMKGYLDKIQSGSAIAQPYVVDTTGSIVHIGGELCTRLKELTRVVYLEASEDVFDEMLARYRSNPRPVVWGAHFAELPGESPEEALSRCYPELLRWRMSHYKRFAHVTLPYSVHRKGSFGTREFISAIRTA